MCDSKHFSQNKGEILRILIDMCYMGMPPFEKEKCAISVSFVLSITTLFFLPLLFFAPFLGLYLQGTKLYKQIRQARCSTHIFYTLYHFFLHFVPFNLKLRHVC
jgi:hypothetical protein